MAGPITECNLCPKQCRIAVGQAGDCRIRINIDGTLRAVTYGHPVAIHVDPVEKKPFFHYHPGERILSVATVGCNMHCKGCQNWQISQADPEDVEAYAVDPARLTGLAVSKGIPLVAYTYTEPLAYYEYTCETAILAREKGLGNAIVSAGYANEGPVRALFKVVDAATIDVKAFDDRFYREFCDGGLRPVLNTLVVAREEGAWLEVSNLVVPGLTDNLADIRKLARWIKGNLGADTPLHFLRFVPHYKMRNVPPTPVATLEAAWKTALDEGLRYVYLGNVPGHPSEDTHCPGCGAVVIHRVGYRLSDVHVGKDGRCGFCGESVAGVFGR
ncbi:MAG: AmmeMemoRadiSam system radical SAM enzyme [Deltaproteobacteria bacterium]|nr:AmmeMemoRadiSam system radical SAM enzyme [Deltaproteobacteria bacterium]